MDHSFEEMRSAALDLIAGREQASYDLSQYDHLLIGVAEVFARREGNVQTPVRSSSLSRSDRELFLEVFWTLFREGIITIGFDDANRKFPFFRVTQFGRKLIADKDSYFFHDVSGYESRVRSEIPGIDDVTLIYLKEAMQSFRTGCLLASSVMLGVATEHTFLLLIERIEASGAVAKKFESVGKERAILSKVNKFKKILDQEIATLPWDIKEDLDTHFAGILSIIRTFRNQSGHPTGKIPDREQVYVLLQLFIPYCKKMYQLMTHLS